MTNPNAMKGLFKPYTFKTFNFNDYLINNGFTLKDLLKIHVQDECSKSIDESCINTDCHHNLLKMHEDELYQEVLQEVQSERKRIAEKVKRDKEKYFGITGD